ncbi:MAG TPA: tol-pal system-associated acyl-CoA thioesterase [Burkholderiaceae bacterium]|jgi:acyl-CoA thioester hydrolase|nr:tol-pal system-associated acyl-CoA thioesterase [Burkholderiaceae bacterium]
MNDSPHSTSAAASVFHHAVRVYWEDTDAGGIVYYANYLKFFERARTEWLRAQGQGQQAMADETGCMFVVQEARVRYARPARLDDLLDVTVEVRERGRASLRLAQQAWQGAQLLAECDIRIGCVARATLKPHRIPAPLLESFA